MMQFRFSQCSVGVVFGLLVVGLIAGCSSGPDMGTVTGMVTVDGTPTGGLEVAFDPAVANTGTTALGYTQPDGTYSLRYPGDKKGAPVGEYIVRITGAEQDDGTTLQLPAKYNASSELRATVQPGENKIDFDLTTK